MLMIQMQQNETSERNNQPTSKEDVSNVLNDADADDRKADEDNGKKDGDSDVDDNHTHRQK